jgi:uncharacterized protein (TIGR03435 family)
MNRQLAIVLIATVGLRAPAVCAAPQAPPAADGRLTFDAATIKLAAPGAVRNRMIPAGPNRIRIPSMTLTWLIYTAYGNGGFNTGMRVEGGPAWVSRTEFAVEGAASGPATPLQLRQMLQALLEDRFALKLRHEDRIGDGLALVVDRADGALGPKVKPWNGSCQRGAPSDTDGPAVPRCPSGYRQGGISLDGVTMLSVSEVLSLPQSRMLLGGVTNDRTGLTGRYTMELDYPFPPQPAASSGTTSDPVGALSTAIREQWGLRLMPVKGPFPVLVIDSAQPPATD